MKCIALFWPPYATLTMHTVLFNHKCVPRLVTTPVLVAPVLMAGGYGRFDQIKICFAVEHVVRTIGNSMNRTAVA